MENIKTFKTKYFEKRKGVKYMKDIFITVIVPIISAVIGAVVGVLFQKLVRQDNLNSGKNQSFICNRQTIILDYKDIHVLQNKTIKEKEVVKTKELPSSNENTWVTLIGVLLICIILVWLYLKFQKEIFYILSTSSIFIISMCLSAIYTITRKNIMIDNRFKSILIWIIVSTVFIPIEINLLMNPIYFKSVNKQLVLETMNNNGLLSILTNQGIHVFGFLLYQVLGIIIFIFFVLHLLCGNIHIWSMINLSLNSKMKSFWKLIYKKTYNFAYSRSRFIGFSLFLLSLSFLLSSGILANLIASNS